MLMPKTPLLYPIFDHSQTKDNVLTTNTNSSFESVKQDIFAKGDGVAELSKLT